MENLKQRYGLKDEDIFLAMFIVTFVATFLISWIFTSAGVAALIGFVAANLLSIAALMIRNTIAGYRAMRKRWQEKAERQAAYEASVGKHATETAAHNAQFCRENNITGWTAWSRWWNDED